MHHYVPGTPDSVSIAKDQASRLRDVINDSALFNTEIQYGHALNLVAKLHGFGAWEDLTSKISEGGSPAEDTALAIEGVSVGYFLRTILNVGKIDIESMTGSVIFRHVEDLASNPRIIDAPSNRAAADAFGWDVLPKMMRLIDDISAPDLVELMSRSRIDVKDPAGVVKAMASEAAYHLVPGTDRTIPGAQFPGGFVSAHKVYGYKEEGIPLEEAPRRDDGSLLDEGPTLLLAPNLARAREIAVEIDPGIHDLTSTSFDSKRFLEANGIPGVRIQHPIDALTWVATLATSRHAGNPPGLALLPRRRLSVLIKASDIFHFEILLSQARQLGFQIVLWVDRDSLKDLHRMLDPNANVRSMIAEGLDYVQPMIWRK